MCWCNPALRTPRCGKIGCNPARAEQAPPSMGYVEYAQNSKVKPSLMHKVLEDSQLVLWQNYCDKKNECNFVRELLFNSIEKNCGLDVQSLEDIVSNPSCPKDDQSYKDQFYYAAAHVLEDLLEYYLEENK